MVLEIGLGIDNILTYSSELEKGIVTMLFLKKIKIEVTVLPQFELELLKVFISVEVFLMH